MKQKRENNRSYTQSLSIYMRKNCPPSRTSQDRIQPSKIIHINVRSRPKIELHSVLQIRPNTRKRHEQSMSNKSSITQTTDITQSTNVSTVHRHHSTPLYKNKNLWYNDEFENTMNSRRKIFSAMKNRSHNSNRSNDIRVKNKSPDWTSFENNHIQKNKKKEKTKCIRICIITSIIVSIVLAIAIIVPLVVLLNTSKSNQTTIDKTAVLRWNRTGITVAGIVNQPGNTSELLNRPIGLALDYLNTLYIADYRNNRVQKYPIGASVGTTVAGRADTIGCNSLMCLFNPIDITVDTDRNVYVLDRNNNRVQFWSYGSSTGITVAGNNSSPNSNDHLSGPYGITRDSTSGTLYISDTFNYRVMCYRSGSLSGTLCAGTGVSGTSYSQLSSPYSIHLDLPSNSLIIANAGVNTIVRWPVGASNWTLVAGNSNGLFGSSATELYTPSGVTLDPMGNIYVADTYNNRIQFFPLGQSTGITIAGVNQTQGPNATLFNWPFSVALDSQLNLYVSDCYNHRVQKFLRY